MQRYVERVNAYLNEWLARAGYQLILTEFVEEEHQYYLRVYIDFLEETGRKEAASGQQADDEAAKVQPETEADPADSQNPGEGAEETGELPRAIGINDCANVSRRLSKWLDKEDFIAEAYTLEVCSRGFLPKEQQNNET